MQNLYIGRENGKLIPEVDILLLNLIATSEIVIKIYAFPVC